MTLRMFATPDSIIFAIGSAAPRSENRRVVSAESTCRPRIISITTRSFRGAVRIPSRRMIFARFPYSFFMVITMLLQRLAALCLSVDGVAEVCARRRELTELVTDHVFGAGHGDELFAVMYGEGHAHELGGNHRPARPGLDWLLTICFERCSDLLLEMVINKRPFFQ